MKEIQEINATFFENPESQSLDSQSLRVESVPEISSMIFQNDTPPVGNESAPVTRSAPTEFLSAVEAAHAGGVSWDMRPHLYDGITQQRLLLDSGSMVTAYPPDPGDKVVPEMKLRAVNGSILKCYGYKNVEV